MKKFLAIPNDATNAYKRSTKEDFLGEFNPFYEEKRFFDSVKFLNWKDSVSENYFGIDSFPLIEDKSKAYEILNKTIFGEYSFGSREASLAPIFSMDEQKVKEIIESYNPNLIRAFNTHFALELGLLAKNYTSSPLIVSVHDPSRFTKEVKDADSVICISNSLKEKAMEEYLVQEEKLKIIPDAVDMNLFSKKKYSDSIGVVGSEFDSKYKILSVSRVVRGKNLDVLVESIGKVRDVLGDVKHIHLGSFKDYDLETASIVKNKVDELGLQDVSHFLGGISKEKLPYYYSWADVYALPTLWEGLGRAQIEALSCGTPVVTTNYAPMNEVVLDGHNGFLSNPHDSDELSQKIISILTNDSLKTKFSENARPSVYGKYDLETVNKNLCEYYSKLLKW